MYVHQCKSHYQSQLPINSCLHEDTHSGRYTSLHVGTTEHLLCKQGVSGENPLSSNSHLDTHHPLVSRAVPVVGVGGINTPAIARVHPRTAHAASPGKKLPVRSAIAPMVGGATELAIPPILRRVAEMMETRWGSLGYMSIGIVSSAGR